MTFFGTVASLKVPDMIVYDVATKILVTEMFPKHTIADLISAITFIVLFSQEMPLRWKEINTQRHTFGTTSRQAKAKLKKLVKLVPN